MYVRGEFNGGIEDLKNVIQDVQNFAIANESFADVGCLYNALAYLRDILYADIEDNTTGTYTECTIQFIDDGTELDVIIKESCDAGDNDDMIFFYGLSRDELLDACESGVVCEGEWKVISVGETWRE